MTNTSRPLALLALLVPALLAATPRQEAGPAPEPPLRFRVTVGDETVELEEGRPVTPRPDGPTWRLEVLPTRRLHMPGAFTFEYPRELDFSGAEGPGGGWWTLAGDGAMISLQKHAEDPAAVLERYTANMLAAGGRDPRLATIELGGRTLVGQAFDLHLGGFHGWEAEAIQEVYGFEAGGASWLLTLQRTMEPTAGPGGSGFGLAAGGAAGLRLPGRRASDRTRQALELLRASFRFEER